MLAAIDGMDLTMSGPVGGAYLGTPVMLILAGLFAVLLAKSASGAYRLRRDVSRTVDKPTTQQNWETHALVAIGALLLLIWSLFAIWDS